MATLNNVRAVVSFHDLKKKRGNGGGLSDGGLISIRHSLSTQDVFVSPPPGKAWGFTPTVQEAEQGFHIFNFDSLTANVEIYEVLEDGTEFLLGTLAILTNTVQAFETPYILAHPQQLRVKLNESHQKRVLLAALATEFDLPKE